MTFASTADVPKTHSSAAHSVSLPQLVHSFLQQHGKRITAPMYNAALAKRRCDNLDRIHRPKSASVVEEAGKRRRFIFRAPLLLPPPPPPLSAFISVINQILSRGESIYPTRREQEEEKGTCSFQAHVCAPLRPVRKLVAIAPAREFPDDLIDCKFQLCASSVLGSYQGGTCYQIRRESLSLQCRVLDSHRELCRKAALTDYLLKGGRMRRLPATEGGTIDEARRGGKALRFTVRQRRRTRTRLPQVPPSLPPSVGCCIGSWEAALKLGPMSSDGDELVS